MFTHGLKRYRRTHLAAALALLLGAVAGPNARANCDPGQYGHVNIRVPATMFAQGTAASRSNSGPVSIVGLWHATLSSPDGFGYQSFVTWHSDGLEFESADAPPIIGAVCVGVWKQAGRTVRNNHFGWTWDPSGIVPTGFFNLRETLTLSNDGNSYAGDFDFATYDINGSPSGDHKGSVSAKRITLNN